jgi:ADP-ribosylation factor protein 1
MGQVLSTKYDYCILLVGLDAVGKTTLLGCMNDGDIVTTVPTKGFSLETLECKDYQPHTPPSKSLKISCFTVGGPSSSSLQRSYFKKANGVIFVVDSGDRDRVGKARDELHKTLSGVELKDVPLLVLANKRDLPGAMNQAKLIEELNLGSLKKDTWKVRELKDSHHLAQQKVLRKNGDFFFYDLWEGLDWLEQKIDSNAAMSASSSCSLCSVVQLCSS